MAAVAHFHGARDALRFSPSRLLGTVRSACVGFVMLACSGLGSAQQPSLVWVAPGECPQAAAVQAELARLLAESETDLAVEAEAQVERSRGRRYRLELRLRVGSHIAQRALESGSCEELADTAAWLIALAVDPAVRRPASSDKVDAAGDEAAVRSKAPAAPAPSSEAPPSVGESGEGIPAARRAASPEAGPETDSAAGRFRAGARVTRAAAHAGVAFGTAGAVQAELGGAGGMGLRWLYVELALSVLLPRREELAAGGVVRSWSLQLGLRGCALWGVRLRWGPCLTLDGLRTAGHAEGLSTPQPDPALFWAVAGAGLRAAWKMRDRLELTLAGGAGLPISPRPRFTVEGVGDVAPVSVVTGHLRIGLGFVTR